MTTLVILLVIFGVLNVWFLIRNNRVCDFRLALIDAIHMTNQKSNLSEWIWRYEEFEKVSYNRMLFSFWKPLQIESFYDKNPARVQP